jgi:putative transposon-encoded protein
MTAMVEKVRKANKMTEQTEKDNYPSSEKDKTLVKFEVYGEEMLEKEVKLSGNSGRVYLPPNWVNHRVKIIRID